MSAGLLLSELLPGIDGIPPGLRVTGLCSDSRGVRPGDVFVAILPPRGEGSQHGLRFTAAARAAGAVAVLFEPPVPEGVTLPHGAIAVPGLRARLGAMANLLHGHATDAMTVVGVTGTNGKTSITQLIAQAWTRLGIRAGTIGTLGAGLHGHEVATGFTTPLVLETHALLAGMHAQGAQAVVMEVSSHALDQGRVDGVAFDIAVFSNLTRDHLDYHGTMFEYGEAKRRLFQMPGLRAAVINIDDDFGADLLARLPAGVRAIGVSGQGADGAEVRAESLVFDGGGIAFDLVLGDAVHGVRSPLLGRFNVDNLLAVAGVLWAQGRDATEIAALLPQLAPIHGRMNRLGGNDGRSLVVVDYAHTPDALLQALTSLRVHVQGRLLCVFGCGGERDTGKRPQMAAIAEQLADVVVVTDDNPRGENGDAIVADVMAGFARPSAVTIQRDRAKAIAGAVAVAAAGDIVLVAGKGHEDYQEVDGVRHHFDDTEVALAALEARA